MTKIKKWTERKFERLLYKLLSLYIERIQNGDWRDRSGVRTFREAMIMTNSKGLVVELSDGSEFQVTIVRSK